MKPFTFLLTIIVTTTASVIIKAEEKSRMDQLRESWLRARNRAVAPVDQKYHTELQKLINSYTRAGDLEAALEARGKLVRVDELIKAANQPVETAPPKKQPLEAALQGKWTWRTQIQGAGFLEAGRFQFYWKRDQPPTDGQWTKLSDSKVLVTFKNGMRHEVTFLENGKEASVKPLDQSFQVFKISKIEPESSR